MNKQILKEAFVAWLPLAVVIIILSGLIWAVGQQNYRQNANDPQLQLAREISDALKEGTPAETIVPEVGNTELKNSLSPFVLIFDGDKKLVGSSALLNGKNPEFPSSVLDEAKAKGEHTVTWQVEPRVRMATVISYYSKDEATGYVVAGRSLSEVEKRTKNMAELIGVIAAAGLIISFLIVFLIRKLGKNSPGQKHQHTEIIIDSTKEL